MSTWNAGEEKKQCRGHKLRICSHIIFGVFSPACHVQSSYVYDVNLTFSDLLIAPAVSSSSVASGNRSGSILLNFDSEEHQGPSGIQQQKQQQLGATLYTDILHC